VVQPDRLQMAIQHGPCAKLKLQTHTQNTW